MKKRLLLILILAAVVALMIISCRGKTVNVEPNNETQEVSEAPEGTASPEKVEFKEAKEYIDNGKEVICSNGDAYEIKKSDAAEGTSENSTAQDGNKPTVAPENAQPTDKPAAEGTTTPNPTNPPAVQPANPQPTNPPVTQAPSTPNPTPAHQHNWVAQTKTIHHDATGHNEQVLVSAAWDEQVLVSAAWDEEIVTYETVIHTICKGCGCYLEGMTSDQLYDHRSTHMLAGEEGGYYNDYENIPTTSYVHHDAQYKTVHHDAQYTTKWVQDKAAWDETVTTGYKCSSCGATK